MEEQTPVLLVTANVGSIFEDPDIMLNLWIQEFLQTVVRLNVKFIALHCQEVGGKNYETRMQHVDNFVKLLVSSDELKLYDRAEIFLDEDFSCAENFTALGNFYFIHRTLTNIFIWNFEDTKFQNIDGKNVHSGNIKDIAIKEKSKFPQDFFPECKWSRKGYLRTRWNVNGTIFDLVNIHLFHDASNFVAMEMFPSMYTLTRQKALQYTLNRLYNYEEGVAPFFLFGDFNFRTDTCGVIKKLTSGLTEYKECDLNNDDNKLEYKDETSDVIITIGKKEFCHSDHQNVFINDSGEWLKEYDREMDTFRDQLFEFPIQFLPSYPFEEDNISGRSYMKTRCPAWCDRVLLSVPAKQLICDIDEGNIEYGIIGKESCMGDHKPVFLFFNLLNGAGIIESKLPFRRVCSACKLNCSVFCDALNESPVALKSQLSCSIRSDVTPVLVQCNNCKKKHLRNSSRCVDTNVLPMSTVTELSERAGNCHTDVDSFYLATAIPTLVHSKNEYKDNFNFNEPCVVYNSNNSINQITDNHMKDIPLSRFVDDNVSLDNFSEAHKIKNFVSRSFDENAAVRSNSVSMVLENSWRSKTCICLQDTSWRMRSVSSSSRTSWNSDKRVRLKSDPNLKSSLPRIQSHHSSSDEEWFEEVIENVDEVKINKSPSNAIEEIQEYIEFDATPECNTESETVLTSLANQIDEEKKSKKKKYFLFCIPKKWNRNNDDQKEISKCTLKKRKCFRFLSPKNRTCRWCCVV